MLTEKKVRVLCKNSLQEIEVKENTSLIELYNLLQVKLPSQVVCARVNNRTEELDFRIYRPKEVEFLSVLHPSGMRTYVRSLCFVLAKALDDVFPGKRLRIEHSVSKGYFCRILGCKSVEIDHVELIKKRMREIISEDLPFERVETTTTEAIDLFRSLEMYDKVALLETAQTLYTSYYKLAGWADYYYGGLVPSTGYLSVFDLIHYDEGMLLLPPDRTDPERTPVPVPQPKMLEAFQEYTRFNAIAGLSNVGNLNKSILNKQAPYLIKVAEALHEKRIAKIADVIAERHHAGTGGKVVLISGPSSSGKTTFSKRLGIQLMTHLLRPVTISLDDYFLDREKTPLDEFGDYDYESLYALDLDLFNRDLGRLLNGEEIDLPTFNFELGRREYRGNKLKLQNDSILVMEGIHALNPELTVSIDDRLKYRIYVSALTSISIDDHNWIPTTDNRLLRRIIRDNKYRNTSAQSTLARWPSVRRGEDKWIFPYQENADTMFNSALLFELAVIRRQAETALRDVPPNCAEYGEAKRLLRFLSYFQPIEEAETPSTSLLREFLGGSSF